MWKKIRLWFCKHLDWHSIDPKSIYTDPKDPAHFLTFGKCKICGYEGMIDSQGNLF